MKFKLFHGRKPVRVGKVVPLVQIIEVACPKCRRKFRTVPAVVQHAGDLYCPKCGLPMEVSAPQPVSVLARAKGSSAA
jgi:hypothetical protein